MIGRYKAVDHPFAYRAGSYEAVALARSLFRTGASFTADSTVRASVAGRQLITCPAPERPRLRGGKAQASPVRAIILAQPINGSSSGLVNYRPASASPIGTARRRRLRGCTARWFC